MNKKIMRIKFLSFLIKHSAERLILILDKLRKSFI